MNVHIIIKVSVVISQTVSQRHLFCDQWTEIDVQSELYTLTFGIVTFVTYSEEDAM